MIHTTVRPFPKSTGKLDLISVKHQFTITTTKWQKLLEWHALLLRPRLSQQNEGQLSWDLSLCRQPPYIIQNPKFHIVRAPQGPSPTIALSLPIVHDTLYSANWVWTWHLQSSGEGPPTKLPLVSPDSCRQPNKPGAVVPLGPSSKNDTCYRMKIS